MVLSFTLKYKEATDAHVLSLQLAKGFITVENIWKKKNLDGPRACIEKKPA